MQENGVSANQVVQIRGYADQQLRKPDNPEDPSNRRISLIVQYMDPKEGLENAEPKQGPENAPAPPANE